jgi:hypothetical protein
MVLLVVDTRWYKGRNKKTSATVYLAVHRFFLKAASDTFNLACLPLKLCDAFVFQYKHAIYVQTCKLFADLERLRQERETKDAHEK